MRRGWGRRHALNLKRQKDGRVFLTSLIIVSAIRYKARIAKPFVDQIGVHCVTPRNLRNRNSRSQRLHADRTLLIIRPKPLLANLLPGHHAPRNVHYR